MGPERKITWRIFLIREMRRCLTDECVYKVMVLTSHGEPGGKVKCPLQHSPIFVLSYVQDHVA